MKVQIWTAMIAVRLDLNMDYSLSVHVRTLKNVFDCRYLAGCLYHINTKMTHLDYWMGRNILQVPWCPEDESQCLC